MTRINTTITINDIITKTLEGAARLRPELPRDYLGASSIGHKCNRQIWYVYNNIAASATSGRMQLIFDLGYRIESMLYESMRLGGIDIRKNTETLYAKALPNLRGHVDAILYCNRNQYAVVDFKSCSHANFTSFVRDGLKKWSEMYYTQLQCYMNMLDLDNALLFAFDKDSAKMHAELINYDDLFFHEIIEKAKIIIAAEEPPPKINKSPLYYVCAMCKYKEICHK